MKQNAEVEIKDFIENPANFVSDLAIISINYFENGNQLKNKIHILIDNKIKDSSEYQLTQTLMTLKEKGTMFVRGKVDDWLECGNMQVTIDTHKGYFNFMKEKNLISKSLIITNSVLKELVYLGDNVEIDHPVIGSYISVGENSNINETRIQNSIIQNDNRIKNANLANSMLGNFVTFEGIS